ncbi:MAG: nucleotidyltransferase domain-containing protein [Microcoleus sp.]
MNRASNIQGAIEPVQNRQSIAAIPIAIQPILTYLKQDLNKLYGDRLRHLTLFGSQARGDAQPESDIDVLVVLKSPVNPGEEIKRTGKTIADLSLQYDTVISCIFLDEIDYQTRNGSLLRNIRKEGILL